MNKKSVYFVIISIFLSTLSFQSKTNSIHFGHDYRPKELRELAFRIENLVFANKDLMMIDRYIDDFMNSSKLPSEDVLAYQVNLFANLVEKLQIPQKQLISLQNYAVAMKSYVSKHLNRSLNTIIWWTEVRLITDQNELIKFLTKQINSSMKLKVIDFFAEMGMVDDLKYWQKNIKRNRIKEEFQIAIRKAEIIKLLTQDKQDLSILIETELKRSIYKVMKPFNHGNSIEYEYIYWIIKQMGVFRKNPKISKILNKIVLDESFLYIKKINLLPFELREYYEKMLESNLELVDKALQAMTPFEKIHKNRHRMYAY